MSTAVQLAPTPVFKAFDNNGLPLFAGLLYTYVAGSSTPQATYTDSTGATPNTNPVQLNARGEANVWLASGLTYKLTLKDALGNQIWSVDQIPGGTALTQASLGLLLYPQTAAEAAASVTPTNYYYPAIPLDIRRYGGGNTATAATNRAAITQAIAVAGGADYGYGQSAFECHFPDGGTYNIASGGDLVMPVNMTLLGPGGLSGVTLALQGTDHIVWRNPFHYGGAQSTYQAYWPYMIGGAKNVYFSGGYGVLVITYIGLVFEDCSFGSMTANNAGIELRNTYSLWTERTSFTRCGFGGSAGDAILFNGTLSQANPGVADGSFAYTCFDECIVAVGGTGNLVRVIDGAVAYGIKWGFRGNFTATGGVKQGALFCLDPSLSSAKISEGLFDVRVESGTGLSYLFYLGNGAVFWNNKGHISLPSYDFDSVEINGSFRGNDVEVTGATLYNPFFNYAFLVYPASGAVTAPLSGDWMGSTATTYQAVFPDGEQKTFSLTQGSPTANWSGGLTATQTNYTVNIYQPIYQGNVVASRIVNSVRAREPIEMKVCDLYHSGVMTAGANADPAPAGWVLGQLPVNASTILRLELSCSAGSSGDADSLWHLDIRQGLAASQQAYAGTNSQFALFIPDAALVYNANIATSVGALPNYSSAFSFQPALTSQPTNVGASHNNGTGPTDLRCRIYYF